MHWNSEQPEYNYSAFECSEGQLFSIQKRKERELFHFYDTLKHKHFIQISNPKKGFSIDQSKAL